jgi:lipopolysaccharide/colanic/teichoic acid biosynthesis glycosyltransferase
MKNMSQSPKPSAITSSNRRDSRTWPLYFLTRGRWQLLLGVLCTVWVPAIIFEPDGVGLFNSTGVNGVIIAALLALLGGFFAVRRMIVFPGINIALLVLPVFCTSFGISAIALGSIQPHYPAFQLATSCILALAFFCFVLVIQRRHSRPRIGIVPGGAALELINLERVEWVCLTTPNEVPQKVDAIIADLRADFTEEWLGCIAQCALEGLSVYHFKQVKETLTGRVEIEHLSENSFGSLMPSSAYVVFKRFVDLIFSIMALPVVVPVMIAAAMAIRVESPGGAIFTQLRIGYQGRPFTIVKLRTMRNDMPGAAYTQGNDLRITRVGRVLRKYRIDELPQIWNILCGEMSWIGPRPESAELSSWYEKELGFYSYRHIVRPGITGWAQVCQGWAALPDDVREKLHYDFYYIKKFSPWLDVAIAVQTVRTILTGKGAR